MSRRREGLWLAARGAILLLAWACLTLAIIALVGGEFLICFLWLGISVGFVYCESQVPRAPSR
jgi:hypothetical protein